MPKVKDGGPAFPRPSSEDRSNGDQPDGNDTIGEQSGMSLRDWFAGQALNGLVGNFTTESFEKDKYARLAEVTAEFVYVMADAMLAEREKKSTE